MNVRSAALASLMCLATAIIVSTGFAQAQSGRAGQPASTTDTARTVQVALSEFKIHMPTTLPAGLTVFHVVNTGDMEHDIEFTSPDMDVHLDANLKPGDEGDLRVDLQPGEYRVWCPVGRHALRGMDLTLTVGTADVATAPTHDEPPQTENPAPAAIASPSASPSSPQRSSPAPDQTSNAVKKQSQQPKFIRWLGNFHPPMVNFPIALLAVGALAELLLMKTGNSDFAAAARYCVRLGALTALAAGILGWFFGGFHVVDQHWPLAIHRWLGTSTVVVSLLAWGLGEASWRQPAATGARARYRFVLLLAAVMVLSTGFFGGALVFGLNHYAWPK